jgi:RNA polymerase sigma-70 factor (ECF subfamily)
MTQANFNSGSASLNPANDLIEACRRGDQKAQLQIYKLYYKSIYPICLQIANDPFTAEDIMHESFLSAFENISTYCGNMSFYSWLNSFIKNNV